MTTQSDKILHRIKNVAQVLKCLQSELDKLGEEVANGVVSNTDGDVYGDVRRTSVQMDEAIYFASECDTD